jgi:serine/threonine-protein kinase
MSDSLQVVELLEEALASGRSAEEVCADWPELLGEVRKRLSRIDHVRDELDSIFPESLPSEPRPGASPDSDEGKPDIPGYLVESVIGRGGMGVVFKARHLKLNRPVAIKMMLAGVYAGRKQLARFLREAEALAGLRHPNIVQVYDVGDLNGLPYFTMEYVEGGSLAHQLVGTPQPARQAVALLRTLCEATHAAHQGGILHRDLKPANVLLTADGSPKISDFGLARRMDSEQGLTWSGIPVGTPSYMAPEQADGRAQAMGPAVDVYALGAILYELLTGRPPFRAETTAATMLQVVHQEPVPPSRLNANVPRDLETICLTCLHKEPQRRYSSGAALAGDLERFERGEPILARPAGLAERVGKWVRRNRTESVTLGVTLALLVALLGGSLWYVAQQGRRRDAIEADLKKVAEEQDNANWSDARTALGRAEARLSGAGLSDLHVRLEQAQRDLGLVKKLDDIRLKRLTHGELSFYKTQANRDYADTFQKAGLGTMSDSAPSVAAKINASAVRGALVGAVHDWAVCAADKRQREWLLTVSRHTTSDEDGWQDRVLDSALWDDPVALLELTRSMPEHVPVSLLLALGERLKATGGDAPAFLKRVQKDHPADFWVNLILGNALVYQQAPGEASGYYRAVLASRPKEAVGYCAVGDTLRMQNSLAESAEYYQKSIQIDSNFARGHSNLGLTLQAQGRLDEAISRYEHAVQLDPNYAWAHQNLGGALSVKGRLDEAYDHCAQALQLEPKNFVIQMSLNQVLLRQGRRREAQANWRTALESNPSETEAWFGYPELCLFLGEREEYRRIRGIFLDRFGATKAANLAEPISRTCLLEPGTEEQVRKASELADRAIAAKSTTLDWIYRYYVFAKGLADYRAGKLKSAIEAMEGEASRVMGPAPGLVLAMAQYDSGKKQEARRTLAKAVAVFDWSDSAADNRDVWIVHILRREAEARIVPNVEAFLKGAYQPVDGEEQLALVGTCQFQGLHLAAARLYAGAFEGAPALAEELKSESRYRAALGDKQPVGRLEELATVCRYPAARSAALVGLGRSADANKLSDGERAQWRERARTWLRADLALWTEMLKGDSNAARAVARNQLAHWRADKDFSGVREPAQLERLSPRERDDWLALWRDVDSEIRRTASN